jgi:inosine/xanthosine triphosphatase
MAMFNVHWTMRVGVGSMNEVKVEAVRICFDKFFGGAEIIPVAVKVPPQPIGFEETLRGALIRSLEALRNANADLGIGIEAGLIKVPHSITGYVDQHVCAIIDVEEKVTLGFSMTLELPEVVTRKILSGQAREVEEVMEEVSGIREIGRKCGAVGYLTRDHVSRIDLCVQAVTSALIPRLNPQLYGISWPRFCNILGEKL